LNAQDQRFDEQQEAIIKQSDDEALDLNEETEQEYQTRISSITRENERAEAIRDGRDRDVEAEAQQRVVQEEKERKERDRKIDQEEQNAEQKRDLFLNQDDIKRAYDREEDQKQMQRLLEIERIEHNAEEQKKERDQNQIILIIQQIQRQEELTRLRRIQEEEARAENSRIETEKEMLARVLREANEDQKLKEWKQQWQSRLNDSIQETGQVVTDDQYNRAFQDNLLQAGEMLISFNILGNVQIVLNSKRGECTDVTENGRVTVYVPTELEA